MWPGIPTAALNVVTAWRSDQLYGRNWESQSPRGKWYWLREYMGGREKWDQQRVDTFLVCTTCEMCETRCSTNLPIEPSWTKLRGTPMLVAGRWDLFVEIMKRNIELVKQAGADTVIASCPACDLM